VALARPELARVARHHGRSGLTARGQVDAVLCANDHLAAELLHALGREGVRVPRDLRVVGFDDVRYATLMAVPLTTMHQPCRAIAVTAFRAMLDRLADPTLPPRSLVLSPRLVVRESCGAYVSREP
jgi:DNA-binding LacI/PurR family transcriptional regulator